jgi:hypothetical protein
VELSLLIPGLVFGWYISASGLDVGFRHFLAPYFFMLLLATRAFGRPPNVARRWAWSGIAAVATLLVVLGAAEGARFHPDYIAYSNFADPWLAISDTNVDYSQSLVEMREWIDAGAPIPGEKSHGLGSASTRPRRPIYLYYWTDPPGGPTDYWLGKRVLNQPFFGTLPKSGLLVVSPVRFVGAYAAMDTFSDLRHFEPDAVIGHCALVYDMDSLYARGFRWTRAPMHSTVDDDQH